VLVDTPGIFAAAPQAGPRHGPRRLGRAEDADAVVHLVDVAAQLHDSPADRKAQADVETIIAGLKAAGRKAILALNKIDGVKREDLLGVSQTLFETGVYDEVFMISRQDRLRRRRPQGPPGRPDAGEALALSRGPDRRPAGRLLAAEITREKLYLRVHEELPYAPPSRPQLRGTQGRRRAHRADHLRRAREPAPDHPRQGRPDPEVDRPEGPRGADQLLDRPVHLFLHVSVDEKWADKREFYGDVGLDFDS
jgi:GTP-binding protein Era